jgi:hypothetical protein
VAAGEKLVELAGECDGLACAGMHGGAASLQTLRFVDVTTNHQDQKGAY